MHAVAKAGAPYDLVISDMLMLEMDGHEATRRIRDGRASVLNSAVPVFAMKGDREKCLQAGMTDYVAKPIQPDMLLQTIEKHLSFNG